MHRKYLVLFMLSILSVITFLDRNAISLAGIQITKDLQLTESAFGWILAAFTISYGLFEIPTGLWGDRFGERKVLARIVLGWSVFTSLTGLALGFVSLFTTRFLFGAAEAGAYPNTAIAIRKWFGVEQRARAQAVIWMASRVGGAITPFVIVPLQSNYGWRMSFVILGSVGVVWAVLWLLFYKSPVAPAKPAEASTTSWTMAIRNKNFWLLMVMYYCYACGVFFFISWLPKYLHNGRGIPQEELAYSASLPFMLAAFGCLFGGAISDALVKRFGLTWGRRIVPLVGLTLSGVVMLFASFTPSNAVAVVALAFGMAFMDVTAPVAWALATGLGKENSGAVTGAMNTAGLLGGTIASLGVGYLISWTGSYQLPVVILGLQLIVGGLLTIWIKAES